MLRRRSVPPPEAETSPARRCGRKTGKDTGSCLSVIAHEPQGESAPDLIRELLRGLVEKGLKVWGVVEEGNESI
jgi:hypothetical protein